MAAALSLCSTLTPKLSNSRAAAPFSHTRNNLTFIPHTLSSLTLTTLKRPSLSFTAKLTSSESAVSASEPETENSGPEDVPESDPAAEIAQPKREEVFAVVMVGSRQYIMFPGRFIYIQRLKGASVNDKIILNKVLLVGTKTSAYIGKPLVPNARVEAIVEEQTLDKKVIVFKYKKKKNYRRNIGHRQPITRIRITSITGYQDSPVVTLPPSMSA
ncbi:50S ribosomal protein L21 [Striga asiatica]|uniref:50S ribosomal protein L21 n=1 Tax=Striga asiatica TaxID=4170 RepID=A0A5A7P3V9_STRAF|nr:50S ribosomal protein L21 [Striga asiatica]